MSRATPRWVLIGLALWALVYCPVVLYLLNRADAHWILSFAAVVVPLWFGVRMWVHQTTRQRAERRRRFEAETETSLGAAGREAEPTDDEAPRERQGS